MLGCVSRLALNSCSRDTLVMFRSKTKIKIVKNSCKMNISVVLKKECDKYTKIYLSEASAGLPLDPSRERGFIEGKSDTGKESEEEEGAGHLK